MYNPLEDHERNTRIFELLPGDFGDVISIRILVVKLEEVASNPDPDLRLSLGQLKETLPRGWKVHRTPDDRYLFTNGQDNSWTHPGPDIDRSKYGLPPEASSSRPKYEAISYAWGSSQTSTWVQVMGNPVRLSPSIEDTQGAASTTRDTNYRLAVTNNLFLALRHLRRPNEIRTLWADAVCIN